MVAQGWALAYRYFSADYVSQEERAKKEKNGIWQFEFEPPWDWRRNHPQLIKDPQPTPPPSPRGPQHIYYPPGDLTGTRYSTNEECNQARQRAGNVGVCVMK